ncbi:MAG: uracil-DNA glycosylase [Bryobacterales bacterium]|nr:uracil-DNA glycosylase [Bryobacterales bacterium]
MKTPPNDSLKILETQVISCRLCPRLVEHRERIARVKRKAYLDWEYWGKPVPAFGDPKAEVMVLGLAPAAHGANRTGRMFTGDPSGDFLYRALWLNGFASQPTSTHREDGMRLRNIWITASVRCAPPDNKPAPDELQNCRPYLERELALLPNLRLIVALGKIGADSYLRLLRDLGEIKSMAQYPFGHGAFHEFPRSPSMLCSYHPSQQNTSTKKLTAEMLREIFHRVAQHTTRAGFPIPHEEDKASAPRRQGGKSK